MKIILIDGNSLMYRAYYATSYTGNLMKNSKGVYTNAVYAFVNMINKIIQNDYDAILVAFDKGKHTFRHEIDPNYKAGRKPMPDEMRDQIPLIKRFLDNMNILRYEMDDYEADDIIGTMSKIASDKGFDVSIYSSDKDLFQLIDSNIKVYTPGKNMSELDEYDILKFSERFGGLMPNQMIDLKAIMGDPSDNIKGIPGIGEKTAIKLLNDYKSLEGLYENINLLKGKQKEKIENAKDDAFICKQMVTIKRDSKIDVKLEETFKRDFNYDLLMEFYKELEFKSLIMKLQRPVEQFSIFTEKEEFKYTLINEENVDLLMKDSFIYLENFDDNYHLDTLIGVGVYNELGSFFIKKEEFNKEYLKKFFSSSYEKYVYDYKKIIVTLNRYNIKISNVKFDLLLALYVINPNIAKDELASVLNNHLLTGFDYDEFIYLSGAKKRLPDSYTYESHIAKKALGISKLMDKYNLELKENNQYDLFLMELKLSNVLASMELTGMKIDLVELENQKSNLQARLRELENEIFKYSENEFNINSVKQLGTFLFEELALPVVKKNKTGYSTDNETLEELKEMHPVIKKILEYRQLMKLFTTYIIGIKDVVRDDSCVHTIFKQALTQTGRLSSIEPNLQNISIRTKEGKNIRKIFVPKNDYILSLDYSQIELRVLADMANVKALIDSFNMGEDIHEKTAKLVLGKSEVTHDERRSAKVINFGIIYGMQPYTLGQDLGISTSKAKEFMDKYFEAYPEINVFMNEQINFCKEHGFVTTIKNRRRYISDINSKNYQLREFSKRTAMNAPIQGSAADIIKLAMIDVFDALKDKKSKMICQVHDELIFDCTEDEVLEIMQIVKEKMENVLKLKVPLIVDGSYGKTWFDAK